MNKNKLYNNILDLCIYQEIENSKNFLDLLYLELKICQVQMNFLEKEKYMYYSFFLNADDYTKAFRY